MSQPIDQDTWIFRITKGPSSLFAVLFAISCVLHIYQSRKHRCWAYTWQLPFGCILAMAAFICLEISAFHHTIDNASAVIGLLYISALLFTLPTFSILSRLLSLPPTVLHVPTTYALALSSAFTSAIITCTSTGAATYFIPSSSNTPTAPSGRRLLQASLFLFLSLNAMFLGVLCLWYRRQTTASYRSELLARRSPVRRLVHTLCIVQGIMVVRNVFRTVQMFQRSSSGLWLHEGWFWVLEVGMLVLVSLVWHHRWPARDLTLRGGGCGIDNKAAKGLVRRGSDEEYGDSRGRPCGRQGDSTGMGKL